MPRTTALLAALLLAAPAVAAPAAPRQTILDVTYAVTLAGVTLGGATLQGEVAPGKRYEVRLEAALKGIASALVDGEGKATSRGRIDGPRVRPRFFSLDSRYRGVPLTERMTLDDGTMTGAEITPKPTEREDRVPPGPDDRKDVVDPLSGLVGARIHAAGAPGKGECDRTIPVHDGFMRFDMRLSPAPAAEAAAARVAAVDGPLVACQARYVPISNHRPGRWAVKAMQENEDIRVWLAPVGDSGVMVPARISVGTYLGSAVIEATRFSVREAERR